MIYNLVWGVRIILYTMDDDVDSVVKYMLQTCFNGKIQRDTRRAGDWKNKPETTFQPSHDNDDIVQSKLMDCSQSKIIANAVLCSTYHVYNNNMHQMLAVHAHQVAINTRSNTTPVQDPPCLYPSVVGHWTVHQSVLKA